MQRPPPRRTPLLAAGTALVLLAAGAPAQDSGVRGIQFESAFRTSTLVGGAFAGDNVGYGLAGGVRYLWPSGVSVALGAAYDEPNDFDRTSSDPARHLEEFGPYAELRLQAPGARTLRPYAGIRAGWWTLRSEVSSDTDGSGPSAGLLLGTEVWPDVWPTDRVGLRLQGVVSAFSLSGYREEARTEGTAWSVEAGLAFFFGDVGRDADGDGVPDDEDDCPDTPGGAEVGGDGCMPDGDRDGRPDLRDACPGTPEGLPVDARGCALDGDGDGVPDPRDRCPDTPEGVPVDAAGCVPDGDGDGVRDRLDLCPDTPAGSQVDERGCRPDADGDGVPDPQDECPGTPPAAEADEDGCSSVQTGLRNGRLTVSGWHFRLEKVHVSQDLEETLRQVGRELRRDSTLRLEIRVHTDTLGPTGYNRRMSQRLAETARSVLLRQYPAVERFRVEATGLGEEPPQGEGAPEDAGPGNRVVFLVRREEAGG